MVADNSNCVFSVHPQEPYRNTRFLISGLEKKDLHATFAGIKSELVMLENVIHFTKSCIVQTLEFIHEPIWPLQILKKSKCSQRAAAEELSLVLNSREIWELEFIVSA